MANNYAQFSFAIDNVTEEEQAWIEAYKAEPNEEDGLYGGKPSDVVFHFSLPHLYIYDRCGEPDLEALVDMLCAFMVENRPKGIIGFEIAFTCSKSRTDEFGGAAVAIYGTGHDEWMNTSSWLYEQKEAWEKEQAGSEGD